MQDTCPQQRLFTKEESIQGLKITRRIGRIDQQIIETPKSTTESIDLRNIKINDKIKYRISINDDFQSGVFLSRACKSTGKLKHRYYIRDGSGKQKSIALEHIEWTKEDIGIDQKQGIDNSEEENIVMIPKNEHNNESP